MICNICKYINYIFICRIINKKIRCLKIIYQILYLVTKAPAHRPQAKTGVGNRGEAGKVEELSAQVYIGKLNYCYINKDNFISLLYNFFYR